LPGSPHENIPEFVSSFLKSRLLGEEGRSVGKGPLVLRCNSSTATLVKEQETEENPS